MGKIIVQLEAQAIVPTLEVYRQYFDAKYPCTDESNDGSDMIDEDLIKLATYDYLLTMYENSKDVFESEYERLKHNVVKTTNHLNQ